MPDAHRSRPAALLVLRAPVQLYPPTIIQAQILGEQGFAVTIAYADDPERPAPAGAVDPAVRLAAAGPFGHPPRSPLARLLRVRSFRRRVRALARELRPALAIAYDAEGAWFLGSTPRRTGAVLVWHFHELPEYASAESRTIRKATDYVFAHAGLPDLCVFPDAGRARLFGEKTGRQAGLRVVANCPRPIRELPDPDRSLDGLYRLAPADARIVLYNGAVGPDHGLETLVRSMPRWPADARLVLRGRCGDAFRRELLRLAAAAGVAERLVFIPFSLRSLQENYRFIRNADVCWTAIDPVTENWRYSATASNKRFEAMALARPQITNDGPGLDELIERPGCGLCVPPGDADAAGEAVRAVLDDPERARRMGEAGRRLHLETWNYDAQFAPVVAELKERVAR